MSIFKDLKRMYFLIGGLGGVMIALSLSMLNVGSLFVNCAIATFWILAINYYLNRIAGQRLIKLRSLVSDCKCREYIDAVQELRSGTKKKEKWLEFDLSSGYLALGDYEKALKILKAVPLRNDGTRIDILEQLFINSNLISIYTELNQIPSAENALRNVEQLLDYPVLRDSHKAMYGSILLQRRIVLDIAKGNYEGNKETLINLLSRERTTLGKVAFHYRLGLIYIFEKQYGKAEECLSFVIENGGDTRFVSMAKEQLSGFPSCP